jgi:2-methylcitrate dehydratase PrpD
MFSRGLAQFVTRINYTDLPREVVSAAKIAMLDYIGVAMAGSQQPSGRIISQVAHDPQSQNEAVVIGHRYRTNCASAALVNGTAGHVLDFDDCLDFPHVGLGHPSTSILPASLAIAEKRHLSGQDLLVAYCLGIEAYAKIGLMIKDAFREGHRWEWTGVLGAMGSTAACAKLLKLDEEKTDLSFGIGGSLANGLIRNFGSMAGHLHAGNAARGGIEAALLAERGFTAYPGIVEAPYGFYNTFTGNQDPLPVDIQLENLRTLGNPWNLINPGLMFKAFPCAHISHFGVDAGLQLRKRHNIDHRNIAEIEFRIPKVVQKVVHYPDPRTGIEGKFSLGYCLCRVLIERKIKISHFTDDAVNDPTTRELMRKIKWVVMDQDLNVGPFGYQEVILKMADGSVYSCKVEHAKGEPQNPQTSAEFTAKYMDSALYAGYDSRTAEQILQMVLNIEGLEDITELADLFMVGSPS